MQLSSDPVLQRSQLDDILERSRRMFAELTKPIQIMPEYNVDYIHGYSGMTRFNYDPPPTRFARLSTLGTSVRTMLEWNLGQ